MIVSKFANCIARKLRTYYLVPRITCCTSSACKNPKCPQKSKNKPSPPADGCCQKSPGCPPPPPPSPKPPSACGCESTCQPPLSKPSCSRAQLPSSVADSPGKKSNSCSGCCKKTDPCAGDPCPHPDCCPKTCPQPKLCPELPNLWADSDPPTCPPSSCGSPPPCSSPPLTSSCGKSMNTGGSKSCSGCGKKSDSCSCSKPKPSDSCSGSPPKPCPQPKVCPSPPSRPSPTLTCPPSPQSPSSKKVDSCQKKNVEPCKKNEPSPKSSTSPKPKPCTKNDKSSSACVKEFQCHKSSLKKEDPPKKCPPKLKSTSSCGTSGKSEAKPCSSPKGGTCTSPRPSQCSCKAKSKEKSSILNVKSACKKVIQKCLNLRSSSKAEVSGPEVPKNFKCMCPKCTTKASSTCSCRKYSTSTQPFGFQQSSLLYCLSIVDSLRRSFYTFIGRGYTDRKPCKPPCFSSPYSRAKFYSKHDSGCPPKDKPCCPKLPGPSEDVLCKAQHVFRDISECESSHINHYFRCYENKEYHMYHIYSFYDLMKHMKCDRQSQPSSKNTAGKPPCSNDKKPCS